MVLLPESYQVPVILNPCIVWFELFVTVPFIHPCSPLVVMVTWSTEIVVGLLFIKSFEVGDNNTTELGPLYGTLLGSRITFISVSCFCFVSPSCLLCLFPPTFMC